MRTSALLLAGFTFTGCDPRGSEVPDVRPRALGQPAFELSTVVVDFGRLPLSPATRTITVHNAGDTALKLGSDRGYWQITARNADSPYSAICVGPFLTGSCIMSPPPEYDVLSGLAPGESVDIPIRIAPEAAGKQLEWEVTFYSDDPAQPSLIAEVKAES